MYSVKSVFDTVQGEGTHTGWRAVFVRFAGCNLWNGQEAGRAAGKGACSEWCDTDFFKGEKLCTNALLQRMNELWGPYPGKFCVLTGGEPFLQIDEALVNALNSDDWRIAVESNGTVDPNTDCASLWIAVSPKLDKHGAMLPVLVPFADEVKVVLPGPGWSLEMLDAVAGAKWAEGARLLLHPQDTGVLLGLGGDAQGYASNVKACVDVLRLRPQWRLGGQLHKLLRLE